MGDSVADRDSIAQSGYFHPAYAASLAEFGQPQMLTYSGGWLLKRPIPGTDALDAMGCYPLFGCVDWSALGRDLDALADDALVSVALVTDPFGTYSLADLQRWFPDVTLPFKQHIVVDLHLPPQQSVSKRHRKHARRALKDVEVHVHPHAPDFLPQWIALYDALIARHDVTGIRAFSPQAFAMQLSIPGATVIYATYGAEIVGAQICLVQGDVVHCHLAAYTAPGYALSAAYALDWASIQYFADKARWYNLGGAAGISNDGTDGLSHYKRGWSSLTRTAYFCGRILNPARYHAITAEKSIPAATHYFPAYRAGEYD